MSNSIQEYIDQGHDTSMSGHKYSAIVLIRVELSTESYSIDDAENDILRDAETLSFDKDDILECEIVEWTD